MAGKIVADTLEHSTAGSIATNYVVDGSAKAWAHFNGTTATIDDNLNFSSLTDNGVGNYNPNLTNNMSSVSYACAGSSNLTTSNRGAYRALTYTTSTVNIRIYGNGSASDTVDISVNIHGDLA